MSGGKLLFRSKNFVGQVLKISPFHITKLCLAPSCLLFLAKCSWQIPLHILRHLPLILHSPSPSACMEYLLFSRWGYLLIKHRLLASWSKLIEKCLKRDLNSRPHVIRNLWHRAILKCCTKWILLNTCWGSALGIIIARQLVIFPNSERNIWVLYDCISAN